MPAEIPSSITILITASKLVFTLIVWSGFYLLARRGEGGPRMSALSVTLASIAGLGWALASSLLTADRPLVQVLMLPLKLLTTLALGYAAYKLWPSFRQTVTAAPQTWLIGVQTTRAIGGVFLVLLGLGLLPGAFAFPAGIGDVLTGVAAPFVAYAFIRGIPTARRWAIAWNIFGMIDLLVALTTGFASSPLLARVFGISPTSALITAFPLSQIPTFLVPVAILLHVLLLRGLLRQPEHPGRSAQPASAS